VPSTHAEIMDAWRADLVTGGVVSSADEVYQGDRVRTVQTALDLRLIRVGGDSAGRSAGYAGQRLHVYDATVTVPRALGGAGNTGEARSEAAEAVVDAIRTRYHGTRRMDSSLTASLVSIRVEATELDADEEGVARAAVTFIVDE